MTSIAVVLTLRMASRTLSPLSERTFRARPERVVTIFSQSNSKHDSRFLDLMLLLYILDEELLIAESIKTLSLLSIRGLLPKQNAVCD